MSIDSDTTAAQVLTADAEPAPESDPVVAAAESGDPATSQAAAIADDLPVTVIEPPRGWTSLDLQSLWRYRDLFGLLVWRGIVARYRQSVVGIGWAIITPLVSTFIFTVIFSRVAGIPSDGSPYPLFAFSALLPWNYFASALAQATGSVVGSGGVIQKVYFPRLILPLVGVVTGLIEVAIQMVALFALMAWFQFFPGWQIVFLPAFLVLAAASALSVGLWLTALNVKYRDVGQAVPFLTQAWMWLSPIVYSSQQVPEHLRPLYGLNPMVGVIEGFRWSLLGST
ncbi:MAG: ABC transporter permease, partial [Planctomycetaceae bacterium]